MQTIYVVTEGDYSDYGIVSLFSTLSVAEEAAKLGGLTRRVEEYILDAPADLWALDKYKNGFHAWGVPMYRDGTTGDINEEDGIPIVVDGEPLSLIRRRAVDHLGEDVFHVLYGTVWAKTKEHAVKIANDKRAQLIAANEWPVDQRIPHPPGYLPSALGGYRQEGA